MFFLELDLFKPETWLSGTDEGIMGAIVSGLRTLFFNIITIVYELIVNVYDLFEKLCSARLLSTEVLNAMSERVGTILGLVMLFYVVFSFIQMLIDPEKISNKDSGAVSIIKKSILVIIMLGVSNSFFNILYKLQETIIDQNIISRLILPYTVTEESKDNFGNLLSASLLQAFYYIDISEEGADSKSQQKIEACNSLVNSFYKQIYTKNQYDYGYMCLNESVNITIENDYLKDNDSDGDQRYIISFNGLIAIAVGAYTVYILVMYCFKVGVRMIQLAFLEIISPMAIISYLSPKKDNMFGKWAKIYFSTYIDVFIRIAIINFIIFLICTIFATGNNGLEFFNTMQGTTTGENFFLIVVLILALLTFAKKAPDLLKELLPAGASKLGFGLGLKEIVGLEKGAKIGAGVLGGALGGAAIGLIGGGLGGFAGGLLKGGLSGLKGQGFMKTTAGAWKDQLATNKRVKEWRRVGGGPLPFGRWGAGFSQSLGWETAADRYDEEVNGFEESIKTEKANTAKIRRQSSAYSDVASKKKEIEDRAENKILNKAFAVGSNGYTKQQELLTVQAKIENLQNNNAPEADIARAKNEYFTKLDEAKKWYINESRQDNNFDTNMNSMFKDIQNTIAINADGAFNDPSFAGMNTDFNTFADLDQFEGQATKLNGDLKREVAQSDARIQSVQDQIDTLKSRKEYIRAQANKKYSGKN